MGQKGLFKSEKNQAPWVQKFLETRHLGGEADGREGRGEKVRDGRNVAGGERGPSDYT